MSVGSMPWSKDSCVRQQIDQVSICDGRIGRITSQSGRLSTSRRTMPRGSPIRRRKTEVARPMIPTAPSTVAGIASVMGVRIAHTVRTRQARPQPAAS
jgi:hypothetical protein